MTRTAVGRIGTSAATWLAVSMVPAWAFANEGGGHEAFPWTHWGVSMLNFAIFAGVLVWWAGPKVQEHFKKRADALRADIDDARELRVQAQKQLDEYSGRLEKLEDERKALMDEYHKQGEREKERIVADAQRQVDKMKHDAEVVIQQEVRKAVAAIEREAVDIAVNMARTSLQSKLDERAQNSLVDTYVSDLKSMES